VRECRVYLLFHQTDILRLENLWQFSNLRRLQLDNNIIEEIPAEALASLTQLEWLDLSFNNIEEISGLDNLVQLRDLSLAHNRIKTVGNLDALKTLQVLSLANNLIEENTEWDNVSGHNSL
jgi:Leucine-rich repeat (LRR) protein